jgi:hypothetical protein
LGFVGNAIGSVIGGITGSNKQAKAAQQAGNTQAAAADRAIAEQRFARDEARGLQQPFVDAGSKALAQQMTLIGLNGTGAQQDSLNALLSSPEYTTALAQGEESILQNAAATGGLRGGNTQNSLARYRGDLLASTITNKYNQLGGLTSLGQNAAAGVGNNGLAVAENIGGSLADQGAAIAGGQIAIGNRNAAAFNNVLKTAGAVASVVKAF